MEPKFASPEPEPKYEFRLLFTQVAKDNFQGILKNYPGPELDPAPDPEQKETFSAPQHSS